MSSPSSSESSYSDNSDVDSSPVRNNTSTQNNSIHCSRQRRETIRTAMKSLRKLPTFSLLGQLFGKNNEAFGEQHPIGSIFDYTMPYSPLDLGKLVLLDENLLERVVNQAPQECFKIIQQLANDGCGLADQRLDELVDQISRIEEGTCEFCVCHCIYEICFIIYIYISKYLIIFTIYILHTLFISR